MDDYDLMPEEAAKRLASAIYTQAMVDYVKYSIKLKHGNVGYKMKPICHGMIAECEQFFNSEWAEWLTELTGMKIDPHRLIAILNDYAVKNKKLNMNSVTREEENNENYEN